MLAQCRALDHQPEALEPLGGHVGGHEAVGHGRRLGARAGREQECVGAVVLRLGHHLERPLEVVVGLAGEPDDDVGRHRQVGDGCPRRHQPLEVATGGIAAVHGSQDPVAPRLQREMEVFAHGGRLGH